MIQAFICVLAAASAAALSLTSPTHAAEADFLKRFGGAWSGSGTVAREATEA